MDGLYPSKARNSQGRNINDNFKAFELLKLGIFQQRDKRLLLPVTENVVNKIGEATKQKPCTSNIDEATNSNTCSRVNSLPQITITSAAKSGNELASRGAKKHFLPSIKVPLYPRTLLQQKITSTSPLRRTPSSNPVTSLVPLRAQLPIERAVKPESTSPPPDDTNKSTSQTAAVCLPPITDGRQETTTTDDARHQPQSLDNVNGEKEDGEDFGEDIDDDFDDYRDDCDDCQNDFDHYQDNFDHHQDNFDHYQDDFNHYQDDFDDYQDDFEEDTDGTSDDDGSFRDSDEDDNDSMSEEEEEAGEVLEGWTPPDSDINLGQDEAPPNDEDDAVTALKVVRSTEWSGGHCEDADNYEDESFYSEDEEDLASQYILTPLEMIVNELFQLHGDMSPSTISPMLTRAPAFTGLSNDGLLTGRRSPKLDIPCGRFSGCMKCIHPLVRVTHTMVHPGREYQLY